MNSNEMQQAKISLQGKVQTNREKNSRLKEM